MQSQTSASGTCYADAKEGIEMNDVAKVDSAGSIHDRPVGGRTAGEADAVPNPLSPETQIYQYSCDLREDGQNNDREQKQQEIGKRHAGDCQDVLASQALYDK